MLTAAGIPAVDLHGNLSQPARERNLEAFSNGSVRVLVATDIAARGIHVDAVELVVHVDPPAEHKAYLHRSGRTARAGSGGDVVTLVLPEQAHDFRALTRLAKITATPQPVHAGAPALVSLVGEVAPSVTPRAVVATPGRGAPKRSGSRVSAEVGHRSGGGAGRRSGGSSRSTRARASGTTQRTYTTSTPGSGPSAGAGTSGATARRSSAVELSMRTSGRRRSR